MDKKTIIRNFSRYAYLYDKYSDMQSRAASELVTQIKNSRFKRIMEVGCGTGNYTLLLREKFKHARIKAVDISGKMIEVARLKLRDDSVEFMVQDAENLNLDEEFDLLTSNACFQWFSGLTQTLSSYKELLGRNGIILFSLFGPLTFWELNFSLRCVFKDTSIVANDFITIEKIKKILSDNFKDVTVKETRFEESFATLRDLLNKIKYTGVRGDGLGAKISFDRGALREIEHAYLKKFHTIRATYQVFFCKGSV